MQDEFNDKVQCKVLDCDTISQVKSKILDAVYKNTAFSLRPSVYDVDLGKKLRLNINYPELYSYGMLILFFILFIKNGVMGEEDTLHFKILMLRPKTYVDGEN